MASFWDTHEKKIDLDNFRADDQYLGEQYSYPYEAMLKDVDKSWLEVLKEDGAFGCVTRYVSDLSNPLYGTCLSRDLLDSIVEISFLDDCGLRLDDMRVLDIGAGYGRFAHRFTTAFPGSYVYCTDAVPVSLDVCQKYLGFRGVTRAEVILPQEIDDICRPDLAVNIHSFPEMTRADVNAWLKLLQRRHVPHLFVVPHPFVAPMTCLEDGKSFMPDIEAHGFKLAKHWRGPDCWPRDFYLFGGT